MKDCKCENISLYEEGHRCIRCFKPYIPKQSMDYVQSEVASLIKEEFDNYAPCNPPISIQEFMEALEEVVNDCT